MTDLCDEDNAEEECYNAIKTAIDANEQSWEAWQMAATFRISQQNFEQALESLNTSYLLWREADFGDKPPFEFRVATAKLYIELETYTHAVEILEELVANDDQIAEGRHIPWKAKVDLVVWFLLATAHSYISVHESPECLKHTKSILKKAECTDPIIWEKVTALEKRVEEELKKNPVPPPEEVDEESDEEMDE